MLMGERSTSNVTHRPASVGLALNPPRRLSEFGALSVAETRLVDEMGSGMAVAIGDGLPRPDAGSDQTIRADLIRYLLLGGDDELRAAGKRLHERGLKIAGARISGVLDLQSCTVPCDIALMRCRFDEAPVLVSARLQSVAMNGSVLPGLAADFVQCRGGVTMDSVEATGEVRFIGADIGGKLDFDNAHISNPGKNALTVNRAITAGVFFLRGTARVDGLLNMTDAHFRTMADALVCGPAPGELNLNRLTYDAFIMDAPVSAEARIKWLGLQDAKRFGADFWPQPYEQCAKVLREMGDVSGAQLILIEKEKLQRRAARQRAAAALRPLLWLRDAVLGLTIRYGHRPILAVVWLLGFWLVGTAVFGGLYQVGSFMPNSVTVLRSAEWMHCDGPGTGSLALPGENQRDCFLRQPEAQSYPRFYAPLYALDSLVPIIDLDVQGFWRPDEGKPWGELGQAYLWFQVIVGWALSFLAVAGFSGLVKSR
jgi:hypothetical protein